MPPTCPTTYALEEVSTGLKAGIIFGPGLIGGIALMLTLVGAMLFPIVGHTAWDPVLSFITPDALAPSVVITFVLGAMLLGTELVRSELYHPNFVQGAVTSQSYIMSWLVAAILVALVLISPWIARSERNNAWFHEEPPKTCPATANPVEHRHPTADLPRSPPTEVLTLSQHPHSPAQAQPGKGFACRPVGL